MTLVCDRKMDAERALYGSRDLVVRRCVFDGPADGESALKECRRIVAESCYFNLRYPCWHVQDLKMIDCELTELCRAALWYVQDVCIDNTRLHGIKALRECDRVTLRNCDVVSSEFGWFLRGLLLTDCRAKGEYFLFQAKSLRIRTLHLVGKYSFQYVEDAFLENCTLETKDAFWHARRVVVRDSVLRGEYLGWYSDGLTLERCTIIGTQPLCYCKNLVLRDCRMSETDLCFEKSDVQAEISTHVLSIKNPASGTILVPSVGEIISDDPSARGQILLTVH